MAPPSWMEELESLLPARVVRDEASLEDASSDFGRMIHRRPGVVVRPANSAETARVLAFARERGIAVSTRGQAHTQSGQSLNDGGIVLSTAALTGDVAIDSGAKTVMCGAGTLWKDLVAATVAEGLIPPVLTNNLNVTIGGTLSVAGLGISSFRFGAQTDNVLKLTAVTGRGEAITCSPDRERDVFDFVRGGLGQIGVITGATLALREVLPDTRTYFLLYDDLAVLMSDARALMNDGRFDYLESWCVPCPQGFRRHGGEVQAFAEWFFPLHATVEYAPDAPPEDETLLRGLSYYKHVHTEERPIQEFANRLEPLFALWKRAGYWAGAHPWMETILPWENAAAFIGQALAPLPPQALGGGHILLWPSRGTTSRTPLFMRPPSEFVMGFGILPGVPQAMVPGLTPMLDRASDASMKAGAKRYLSGYVHFDEARWKAHFGEQWPRFAEMKRRHDPDGILNPGFIPL